MKSLRKALEPDPRFQTRKPMWRKFYECSCGAEGIMMSTEDVNEDDTRQIYLAFFQNGWNGKELSFSQKLRWCWQILTKGVPYGDTVVLDRHTAYHLAEDLNKFVYGKLK